MRDIALVLTSPNGQRKSLPKGARFAVLLNKADDAAQNAAALEIARELNDTGLVERTVIAALGILFTHPTKRGRAWAGLVLNGIVVVVGILRLGLGGGVI